jgi:hypothetical protein
MVKEVQENPWMGHVCTYAACEGFEEAATIDPTA